MNARMYTLTHGACMHVCVLSHTGTWKRGTDSAMATTISRVYRCLPLTNTPLSSIVNVFQCASKRAALPPVCPRTVQEACVCRRCGSAKGTLHPEQGPCGATLPAVCSAAHAASTAARARGAHRRRHARHCASAHSGQEAAA
jgi:hypothetical protein